MTRPTAPAVRPAAPLDLDPHARRVIDCVVASLRRAGRLPAADAADFRQELALRVVAAWGRYDPARGARTTFVDRVVRRAATDLLRRRAAACRDRRRERPLALAAGLLAADDARARADAAMDVRAGLATLPPDLVAVAALLMAGLSGAEAARRAGRTRGQFRSAVRRLARHFAHLK